VIEVLIGPGAPLDTGRLVRVVAEMYSGPERLQVKRPRTPGARSQWVVDCEYRVRRSQVLISKLRSLADEHVQVRGL
jgi:hypothetical protein